MADDADIAERNEALMREAAIRRRVSVSEPGPSRCLQCGGLNDRADDGFAVCSDCVDPAALKAVRECAG